MTSMPSTGATTMAIMMAGMMLPLVAPALWCYHRTLRSHGGWNASERTILMAAGYASVWAAVGLALGAIGGRLSPMDMGSASTIAIAPWATGLVVVCAGVAQRSKWKAKYLAHCHPAFVAAGAKRGGLAAAWRDGCRLGVHCSLSCGPLMAAMFVGGLMDVRAMAVVMTVIAAERLSPSGGRVARMTGAVALVAGVAMCMHAVVSLG